MADFSSVDLEYFFVCVPRTNTSIRPHYHLSTLGIMKNIKMNKILHMIINDLEVVLISLMPVSPSSTF